MQTRQAVICMAAASFFSNLLNAFFQAPKPQLSPAFTVSASSSVFADRDGERKHQDRGVSSEINNSVSLN